MSRCSLLHVQTFLRLSIVNLAQHENLIRTQCRLSALMCLVLEMHTRCESKWTQDLDQSLTPPLTFLCVAHISQFPVGARQRLPMNYISSLLQLQVDISFY